MMSFPKDSSVFFTGEWGGGNTSPILIWKENVLDIQIFTSSSKEVWKALRKIIKKKKKGGRSESYLPKEYSDGI